MYTQEALKEAFQKAYSYESRAAWGAADRKTALIGTVEKCGRLYDLYIDANKSFWYTVRIRTGHGPVPEREAVFGKRKRGRSWKNSR